MFERSVAFQGTGASLLLEPDTKVSSRHVEPSWQEVLNSLKYDLIARKMTWQKLTPVLSSLCFNMMGHSFELARRKASAPVEHLCLSRCDSMNLS